MPLRAIVAPLLTGALAIGLAACTPPTEKSDAVPGGLPTGASIVAADPVAPVTPLEPSLSIVDPAGRELKLDAAPKRIVCITGICDDILVALGLEPVGTTTPGLLALPEYLGGRASSVTVIPGGWGNEDVEVIASLEPDLVIGLANAQEGLAEAVEEFAPLWLAKVSTIDDSVGYLRAMGQLTGRTEQAAKVETEFLQARANAAATSAAYGLDQVPVLSMYASGAGSGVNTRETILGDLLDDYFAYPWTMKGSDVNTAYTFSQEEILEVDPAVIYINSFVFGADGKTWTQQVADQPVWARVRAVQDGKAFELGTDLWVTGRGPKALTLVLNEAMTLALS